MSGVVGTSGVFIGRDRSDRVGGGVVDWGESVNLIPDDLKGGQDHFI